MGSCGPDAMEFIEIAGRLNGGHITSLIYLEFFAA
jgi:hypothetical protein